MQSGEATKGQYPLRYRLSVSVPSMERTDVVSPSIMADGIT